MVTSDTHKALFGCNHLGCITMMLVASCIPLPFFAPCDDTLAMLVCSTHWLSIHLRTPPFVCLLACLFAFLFLCLPCLSCLVTLCLFHMLFASFPSIACLLVSYLHLCMYTHGARMHEARAWSPKRKQKRQRHKHLDISQAAMFISFRGLASPIWLCTLLNPLFSSLFSLLDGLY